MAGNLRCAWRQAPCRINRRSTRPPVGPTAIRSTLHFDQDPAARLEPGDRLVILRPGGMEAAA